MFSSEKGLEVYHGSEQLLAIKRAIRSRRFTLLESLIALIVISGSLLLFQAMSQLLISEVRLPAAKRAKGVALVCGPTRGRIRPFAI